MPDQSDIFKTVKTLDQLFDETGLAVEVIAQRAKLPASRIVAIAAGRWTPSPAERERVAAAFDVSPDEIIWGHTMDPRNVRYRRFGMREQF